MGYENQIISESLASRTWGVTLIRMLWNGKGLIGTAGPAAYFLLPEIFQTL